MRKFVLCLFVYFLTLPVFCQAQPEAEFTLNGKPVPQVIATVNGTDLPSQYLENQLTTYRMILHRQGKELTGEEEIEFAKETIDKLVNQELLYQNREKLKLEIDPKAVHQEIERITKQFPSKELFLSALSAQRLTMPMLKKSISNKLMEEELLRKKIAPNVKVSDEKLKAYYEKHRENFKQPERFTVQHIFVAALKPDAQDSPEDPAIKARAERLQKMIQEDARRKIDLIKEELNSGADFIELVQKHSEDSNSKEKDGLLGTLVPDAIYPEIAQAMVKMNDGDVSDVVQTPLGFHILRMKKRIPAGVVPLKEVKTDILNHLLKQEVLEAKKEFFSDLRKSAKIQTHL